MSKLCISKSTIVDGNLDLSKIEQAEDIKEVEFYHVLLDRSLLAQVHDALPDVEKFSLQLENEFLDTTLFLEFEHLKECYIHTFESKLHTFDLSGLAQLPQLKTFNIIQSIHSQFEEVDLSPFQESASIEVIWIEGASRHHVYHVRSARPLRNVDITGLSHCPRLKDLSISSIVTPFVDLSLLDGSPSLESVKVGDVRNPTYPILPHFVKQSDWVRESMGDPSVVKLPRIASLKSMGCSRFEWMADIDLTPLSTSPHLRSLYLAGDGIKRIDLSPLSACQDLVELDLQLNKLKEVDITPLMECDQLQYITLDKDVQVKVSRDYKDKVFAEDWPLRKRLWEHSVLFY